MSEPNVELKAFLAEHQVSPEGKCSCGWDIANYDLERSHYSELYWVGMPEKVSVSEAWLHHIRLASYKFFGHPKKQAVEIDGPDGQRIGFTLERSVLLRNYTGGSLEYERSRQRDYGYGYDGYEPPPRDTENLSRTLTCEEADCRDPLCDAMHVSFLLQIPMAKCAGCGKSFAEGDEIEAVLMQMPGGTELKDGTPIASSASYHPACVPSDKKLKKRAKKLWPDNQRGEAA